MLRSRCLSTQHSSRTSLGGSCDGTRTGTSRRIAGLWYFRRHGQGGEQHALVGIEGMAGPSRAGAGGGRGLRGAGGRPAQHHPRHHGRPGLRRHRSAREREDPHSPSRRHARRERAPDELPRRPDLLSDSFRAGHGPLLVADGRLAHHHGPVDCPSRREDLRRRARRRRVLHSLLREMASWRHVPVQADRPRLPGSRVPRRRGRGPDSRLLGQRLLRRHLLAQRRADGLRRLLHRRVLRQRPSVHRGAGGERNRSVLRLPVHERAPRSVPRGREVLRTVRGRRSPEPYGQVLRNDREHRRQHGAPAGQARRARHRREHSPDLHDRQRDGCRCDEHPSDPASGINKSATAREGGRAGGRTGVARVQCRDAWQEGVGV